jgi:hypothetical protein
MKKTEFEPRYCNGCACTTKHRHNETTFTCLRCGVEKYPISLKGGNRWNGLILSPKLILT